MLLKITFLTAFAVFFGALLSLGYAAKGMGESDLKSRLLHQKLILADTIVQDNI